MVRTILVSTDGSSHAQAAVDLGAELAAKLGARLVLMHVAFRGGQLPGDLQRTATEKFDQAKSAGAWTSDHPEWSRHHQVLEFMGRMILDDAEARAREQGAKEIETLLEYGGPGERILHHARHLPADMIVMGSRGYSEMEGLILGSVSHKVFHSAPCTCITVHQSERQKEKAGPGTVLVSTDGSEHAAKAVDLGSSIAAKTGARLVLLHVLLRGAHFDTLYDAVDLDSLSENARSELDPENHPFARTPLSGFLSPDLSDDAVKEIGAQILGKAKDAAVANGVRDPKLVTLDGDPARAILETVRGEGVDLIAMGTRGLGEVEGMIAGSVSYKVNHAAPCTVMVVR